MKTFTVSLVLSTALMASLVGHAHGGPKKDAKTDDSKTSQTTTTTITSSTTIAIGKGAPALAYGTHLEPILKTVSATDDQRKSITAIVDEFRTRIIPLRKRHDELQAEFLKALTSGQSGETVLTIQSEFIRAQTDLKAQYLALHLKIQQILTPEQNDKFKDYRQKQGWKSK